MLEFCCHLSRTVVGDGACQVQSGKYLVKISRFILPNRRRVFIPIGFERTVRGDRGSLSACASRVRAETSMGFRPEYAKTSLSDNFSERGSCKSVEMGKLKGFVVDQVGHFEQ